MVILSTAGCQLIPYSKKDIDLNDNNAAIDNQDSDAESFSKFINTLGQDISPSIDGWNTDNLLASLYFYNTKIKTAERQYQTIKSDEVIAKFRPQSSLGIEVGSGNGANDDLSKDVEGLGVMFPLETANKRLIRYEIALNTSQSAYEDYRLLSWNERLTLIKALTQYAFNIKKINAVKNELFSRQSVYLMTKKRLETGIEDAIKLQQSKIALQITENTLKNLQLNQLNIRKQIAQNAGIKIQHLEKNPILADDIINNLMSRMETINEKDFSLTREQAIQSRIDLRRDLADYAKAEANLKLEVAKQYPDIKFSPAYLYDFGDKIWTLGISTLIPNLEKNKALIAKAENFRESESSRIIDLQLSISNDIDTLLSYLNDSSEKYMSAKVLYQEKELLLSSLEKKFNNGILSRFELEQEKIKLYEIDYIYLDSLYNLIQGGYEIEKSLHIPFVSQLHIEKEPNE
jgi:cobalt-zinc-cadmium efflux system outer membrane protein